MKTREKLEGGIIFAGDPKAEAIYRIAGNNSDRVKEVVRFVKSRGLNLGNNVVQNIVKINTAMMQDGERR